MWILALVLHSAPTHYNWYDDNRKHIYTKEWAWWWMSITLPSKLTLKIFMHTRARETFQCLVRMKRKSYLAKPEVEVYLLSLDQESKRAWKPSMQLTSPQDWHVYEKVLIWNSRPMPGHNTHGYHPCESIVSTPQKVTSAIDWSQFRKVVMDWHVLVVLLTHVFNRAICECFLQAGKKMPM